MGPPMGAPPGPPMAPAGGADPHKVALIMQLMKGAGAGGPGGEPDADEGKPNGHGMSPLAQIQSLIQDVHDAMRNIPDPTVVNVLAGCIKALTGVQQQLMAKGGPGGA